MSQLFGFFRYHSRADALTQATDYVIALLSFKFFHICAILFEASFEVYLNFNIFFNICFFNVYL